MGDVYRRDPQVLWWVRLCIFVVCKCTFHTYVLSYTRHRKTRALLAPSITKVFQAKTHKYMGGRQGNGRVHFKRRKLRPR
jgi:hypothetical protein